MLRITRINRGRASNSKSSKFTTDDWGEMAYGFRNERISNATTMEERKLKDLSVKIRNIREIRVVC